MRACWAAEPRRIRDGERAVEPPDNTLRGRAAPLKVVGGMYPGARGAEREPAPVLGGRLARAD